VQKAFARRESRNNSSKTLLLGLGMLVMFNLLFIPTWNCVGLLQDPVFVHMAGSETLTWFLACCILLLLICFITLQMYLNRPRTEGRGEHNFVMISCIFLSTLGIMLILFGGPLKTDSEAATNEFATACTSGPKTSQLNVAQGKLQSLRAVPACAKLLSVEECDHFHAFPQMQEAMVLKAMENSYQCSGFCASTNAKGDQINPPTLFSKADYKTSCDGMAARRFRNFAEGLSNQTLTQGIWMLGAAILISFVQLLGLCQGKSEPAKQNDDYGTLQRA